MKASSIFIAFALLGATMAAAQSDVQSQRLVAKELPLDAPRGSSALAAIWQDRLAAEREKLAALAKAAPGASIAAPPIEIPIFEASFKDGDKTVIVSALFTTPECKNFAGAGAPSLNNCPMRVAVLRNGQTRIVASETEFPFVAALKDGPDDRLPEFDNASQRDKTVVEFNPATHEITTTLTLNGAVDTEKASPIRIAYCLGISMRSRELLRFVICATLGLTSTTNVTSAQTCTPTNYSASDIAAAVAASPNANAILKSSSCTWGGAGRSESAGNLCASNGNNFGVLQLNRSNLPPGVTPAAYEAEPLQQQVDTWAAQVGNGNTTSSGYQTLAAAQSSGQPIGSTPVSSGMMAACFQFGPAICNNDVAALKSGQPCGGANPVNINSVPRNPGSATTDGNGQTICSWGGNIQANINASAATCKNGTGNCAPANPQGFATPPPVSPTDIVIS